jgi:transaldolase
MKIWISGTLKEIALAGTTGLIEAVVTNPPVIANWTSNGQSLEEVITTAINQTGLPLYVQLKSKAKIDFLREVEYLKRISEKVIPKIPSTYEGIMAAAELERNGTETLVTTVVSIPQAYVCAAAGVTTICPYLNRLQESGTNALDFIKNLSAMFSREHIKTKIMPASVRTVSDIEGALLAGCSGVIIFYPLFEEMFLHNVTTQSLASFDNDWKNIPYHFT